MQQAKHKQQFDRKPLRRLLAHSRVRDYPPKTLILRAGDPANSLYWITEGSVAVFIEDEDGNDIVIAYFNRGEFFGELGLFENNPLRRAWVRTRGNCKIAELSYARFRQLVQDDLELLFELTSQLAARLTHATHKIAQLAFLDVSGRIAHTLLDLSRQPDAIMQARGIQIRTSRQEIGRLVGCSREMAGRVLKAFEQQGLVDIAGQRIVLLGASFDQPYTDLTANLSFK